MWEKKDEEMEWVDDEGYNGEYEWKRLPLVKVKTAKAFWWVREMDDRKS